MSAEPSPTLLTVGAITIDAARYTVRVGEEPIALTKTEFGILHALVTSEGRVLTRTQLIEQAIGDNTVVTERTIDVHVTSLRGKLGSAREMVETVRGIGYRLSISDCR